MQTKRETRMRREDALKFLEQHIAKMVEVITSRSTPADMHAIITQARAMLENNSPASITWDEYQARIIVGLLSIAVETCEYQMVHKLPNGTIITRIEV